MKKTACNRTNTFFHLQYIDLFGILQVSPLRKSGFIHISSSLLYDHAVADAFERHNPGCFWGIQG